MNKLVIMVLSLFVIGVQVCVGAEKEPKRPKPLDVGDQEPTMVETRDKASRKVHVTPYHTDTRFFSDQNIKRVAQDMLPGVKLEKLSASKTEKSRTKLKLAEATVVHRPQEPISDTVRASDQIKKDSLTFLLKSLAIVDEEVAIAVAGETSSIKVAQKARDRAQSFANLTTVVGVQEKDSREKAADFLKTLTECHKKHIERSSDRKQ